MNVYGELTSAQLENLSSDPTLSAQRAGRLWWRTDLSQARVDLGGTADTLASLAAAQAFTNKTISDYLTMAQISTPTTPSSGFNKIYPKSDGTYYTVTPAGVEAQIGSQIYAATTYQEIATPANPAAGYLKIYPKNDGNLYSLNSSGIETQVGSVIGILPVNRLVNSNFDVWQNNTSGTLANNNSGYFPDQWYVKNGLGTNGVITGSQTTGVSKGALFGFGVKITTAPTAGQANVYETYQVLCNQDSLPFYNNNASFQVQVKAQGNVTQVGIQLFYATSEAKLTTAIGSETLVTVNSSSFVTASFLAQAVGTSQTTAGVIGVRIRPTAVSTGNLYDLNNGYIIEQAMLVVGNALPSQYVREANSFADIVARCQFFFEKSYDLTTAIGTTTTNGMLLAGYPNAGASSVNQRTSGAFKVTKRTVPTVSFFDGAGNLSTCSVFNGNAVQTNNFSGTAILNPSTNCFQFDFATSSTNIYSIGIHWVADARI
jgi:hypothetical protein